MRVTGRNRLWQYPACYGIRLAPLGRPPSRHLLDVTQPWEALYTMHAIRPATSARGLARTIRKMTAEFLEPRIRNALESAADELRAQSSLQHHQETDEQAADAVRQDLATVQDMMARTPGRFCDALGDDIDACLMFGDDKASVAQDGKARRRQLRRSEGLEVALLTDEELELSVLVSTVGSRFERRNREHLDAAMQAVGQACGEQRAETLRSLVGVFALINRFSSLLASVPLSVGTRSKVMSGFQFHVLDELERLYQPLAKALAGEAAAASHHRAAPSTVADDESAMARAATSVTPALGADVQASHRRPASMQDWVRLLHHDAASSRATQPGVPLNSYLATMPMQAPLPGGESGDATGTTLYDHVVYTMQQHSGVSPEHVVGMDLDVLRLVSLFFETFLNNDELCPALRYLVGRLQMPVLRIALEDGSFFDRDDHVARRLIQTLCQIGIGWSSDMVWVERSPAFKEVSALVDEILDHPAPDATLFESALESLLATQAARQEKASRAEGRVVELEVGRSKLKAAKLLVQDELNCCLTRHHTLTGLRPFLADTWSKVLTFVCLRHGEDGAEWQKATLLCDELAEMFAPAASRDESEQRFARVPDLLERLEALMVDAGLTSAHIDESISGLYRQIDDIRASDDDWFANDGEMIIEREAVLEPITLIPPPATPEVELGADADCLDQIHPGTWVRVREHTDSDEFHQVKVAARVVETREILLVDERGARWGIWQEAEFAQAMSEGRIVLVDHDLIVQNTLDAMIAALTAVTADDRARRLSAG
jgi:hypothetical protein